MPPLNDSPAAWLASFPEIRPRPRARTASRSVGSPNPRHRLPCTAGRAMAITDGAAVSWIAPSSLGAPDCPRRNNEPAVTAVGSPPGVVDDRTEPAAPLTHMPIIDWRIRPTPPAIERHSRRIEPNSSASHPPPQARTRPTPRPATPRGEAHEARVAADRTEPPRPLHLDPSARATLPRFEGLEFDPATPPEPPKDSGSSALGADGRRRPPQLLLPRVLPQPTPTVSSQAKSGALRRQSRHARCRRQLVRLDRSLAPALETTAPGRADRFS